VMEATSHSQAAQYTATRTSLLNLLVTLLS
jgi:hypothetical protein